MSTNLTLIWLNNSSLTQIPAGFDYAARVFCLTTHVIYLLILLLNKELHECSMIQKHHTNLIGLLIGLHYCAWIGSNSPNTGNQAVNNILCYLCEVLWAISKYARGYSVLVLASYRLIAVFRLSTFKKLIKSKLITLFSILIVWLVSILIFGVSRFLTNTSHGQIMCFDGYASNMKNALDYFIITSLIGFVLPIVFISVIYVLITRKLNKIGNRLQHRNNNVRISQVAVMPVKQLSGSSSTNINQAQREKHLAQQFVLINLFVFGSCAFLVLLNLCNVVITFNEPDYCVRQLFQIGNLVCQSFIPIVSLVYSPVYQKFKDLVINGLIQKIF
jgi:hypothetical protein